jgi:hypothetical protein
LFFEVDIVARSMVTTSAAPVTAIATAITITRVGILRLIRSQTKTKVGTPGLILKPQIHGGIPVASGLRSGGFLNAFSSLSNPSLTCGRTLKCAQYGGNVTDLGN